MVRWLQKCQTVLLNSLDVSVAYPHPHHSVLKTPQNNQLHILSGLPDPSNISSGQSNTMKLGLATVVCFLSCVWWSDGAPPTCYSRALGLGKETMSLLNKIHTYHRTVRRFILASSNYTAGCLRVLNPSFIAIPVFDFRKPVRKFCQRSSLIFTWVVCYTLTWRDGIGPVRTRLKVHNITGNRVAEN